MGNTDLTFEAFEAHKIFKTLGTIPYEAFMI